MHSTSTQVIFYHSIVFNNVVINFLLLIFTKPTTNQSKGWAREINITFSESSLKVHEKREFKAR